MTYISTLTVTLSTLTNMDLDMDFGGSWKEMGVMDWMDWTRIWEEMRDMDWMVWELTGWIMAFLHGSRPSREANIPFMPTCITSCHSMSCYTTSHTCHEIQSAHGSLAGLLARCRSIMHCIFLIFHFFSQGLLQIFVDLC